MVEGKEGNMKISVEKGSIQNPIQNRLLSIIFYRQDKGFVFRHMDKYLYTFMCGVYMGILALVVSRNFLNQNANTHHRQALRSTDK